MPPVDPDNEITRSLERLKAINNNIRFGVPLPPELAAEVAAAPAPPPSLAASPDQLMHDWANETGQVLDDNGNVVGRTEMTVRELMRNPQRGQETEEDVLGFGRPKAPADNGPLGFKTIQGVNLEKGVVVVDGRSFNLNLEERTSVAKFVLEVMARELGNAIKDLAARSGVSLGGVVATEEVRDLPAGEANDGVQPAPKAAVAEQLPGVRSEVRDGPENVDAAG